MRQMQSLTIGKLAKLAGVGVETVRYYQNCGLLQEPPKPKQGYRHYPREALERLHFIKRAQELGFTLREIGTLIELDGRGSEVRVLVAEKLGVIQAKIAHLITVQSTLEQLIRECDGKDDLSNCPLLSSLCSGNRRV